MRKAEIIAAISDETCIPRVEVQVTLEAFFKILRQNLTAGETVSIQRLGTFKIEKYAGNKVVDIPQKKSLCR
jgi:DNA-binding protein HU-beta